MDWRSRVDGRKFTTASMAAEVAKFQPDLDSAKRCNRQNIDSIFVKNLETPRYLVALAQAMGTTAEILRAGNFNPSHQLPKDDRKNAVSLNIGSARAASSTAEVLSGLGAVVEALHPNVQLAGRDVLRRWAQGDMDTQSAADTLDAFTHVSENMKMSDTTQRTTTPKKIGNEEMPDFLKK